MLQADELERYRQELLQLREAVKHNIEAVTTSCDPVAPHESLGRLTRTDAMQDQQMALHQRERLREQLKRIDTALERIDKGAYGTCPACSKAIDQRRLAAAPDAVLCLSCLQAYRARHPAR